PPRPALFPYTTLFRSEAGAVEAVQQARLARMLLAQEPDAPDERRGLAVALAERLEVGEQFDRGVVLLGLLGFDHGGHSLPCLFLLRRQYIQPLLTRDCSSLLPPGTFGRLALLGQPLSCRPARLAAREQLAHRTAAGGRFADRPTVVAAQQFGAQVRVVAAQ